MTSRRKEFAYKAFPKPFPALLRVVGWFGTTETHVLVVGRTPCRFTIEAIERTRLAGNYNWLEPGEQRRVPLSAIVLVDGEPVGGDTTNESTKEEADGTVEE